MEVITTASMIPNEVGENYLNAFGKIGCTNIGLMPIRNRADAMEKEYIERIKNAMRLCSAAVTNCGLSATFGGTEFLEIALSVTMKKKILLLPELLQELWP